ncbi:MAG TPA: AMMECR1 domain-containing protein, partial [Pseudomonadota bacterium]|nr:AMMECR1 domain-containing protein [Pseudomonadota bacterium]
MPSQAEGLALCQYARASIRAALGGPGAVPPQNPAFDKDGACFVTLYRDGELHGCIGSLEAHQPLLADVAEN